MKTTQSALREGVLFSTKRNNYYYDTGTGNYPDCAQLQ